MTFASLQRSDVAEYTVAEQPPAASPQTYFVDLLAAATESNADVIVRLEDDIEVNRHLLHNIQTWAALQDPDFGVGFLSNASNYCPPFELSGSGCYRSLRQEVSAALGQVFLPRTLHRVLAAIACHPDHLHAIAHGTINFDHVVSKVCFDLGLNVYVHFPALVRETPFGLLHSSWGNRGPGRHPVQPDFVEDWKRQQQIPKIIHQVWIGDAPPPAGLMETWRQKNPSWEYRLSSNMTGWENQEVIDAIPELHGKADVMRYELLWRDGGVFIDADSECVRPLDDFLLEHPVWASWENAKTRPGIVANGYLGARPGHPMYAALLDRCRTAAARQPVWRTIGSGLVSDEARYHPDLHLWPSTMWCPRHFLGVTDAAPTPIYARQFWGSTLGYATIAERRAEQIALEESLHQAVQEERLRRHAPDVRGLPPYSAFPMGSAYDGI
jgi:hypothetical protein